MSDLSYDPRDVAAWNGQYFNTENGSKYSIVDGKILGRGSIEGAEILFINGLTETEARDLAAAMNGSRAYSPEAKKRFDDAALKNKRRPKEGLLVAIGLVDAAAEQKQRVGVLTSRVAYLHKPAQR